MLAVTADMPCIRHTFPYGVWPGQKGINHNPSLAADPTCNKDQERNAYPVVVKGCQHKHSSAKDLFSDACCDSGDKSNFNYFDNPNNDMTIDFTRVGIRVISFPFPTRMIIADVCSSTFINNTDHNHLFHRKTGDTDTGAHSYPVASAHIFEYDGATRLSFDDELMIDHGATGHRRDFHFHTVPPPYMRTAHSAKMLKNLVSLINPLDPDCFDLSFPGIVDFPSRGSYVPKCVDAFELSLGQASRDTSNSLQSEFSGNLASCARSTFGYADNP